MSKATLKHLRGKPEGVKTRKNKTTDKFVVKKRK